MLHQADIQVLVREDTAVSARAVLETVGDLDVEWGSVRGSDP
jgi:hypothetical protein